MHTGLLVAVIFVPLLLPPLPQPSLSDLTNEVRDPAQILWLQVMRTTPHTDVKQTIDLPTYAIDGRVEAGEVKPATTGHWLVSLFTCGYVRTHLSPLPTNQCAELLPMSPRSIFI